jgi:hypothetical protein
LWDFLSIGPSKSSELSLALKFFLDDHQQQKSDTDTDFAMSSGSGSKKPFLTMKGMKIMKGLKNIS